MSNKTEAKEPNGLGTTSKAAIVVSTASCLPVCAGNN